MPIGDEEEPSWTMETFDLDDEIKFDALSYVWGAQDEEMYPVNCNDQRQYVHRNLFMALPYLARRNRYHTRWKNVEIDIEEESNAVNERESPNNESDSNSADGWSVERSDCDWYDDEMLRTVKVVHRTGKGDGKFEELRAIISEGRDSEVSDEDIRKVEEEDIERQIYQTEYRSGWTRILNHEVHSERPLRPIWIDALCINQNDKEEKASQIASMNQVYRKAQKVWVWLGFAEDQDSMQDAVDLIPVVACAVYRASKFSGQPDHHDTEDKAFTQAIRQTNERTRQALNVFLNNEWFRRVWILQEFVLARSVMFLYGRFPIEERLVFDALRKLRKLSLASGELLEDATGDLGHGTSIFRAKEQFLEERFLQNVYETTESSGNEPRKPESLLLKLAEETGLHQQCLLPQDRVFGILGILTPTQYEELGKDLFGITDTAKLYTEFSAATLPVALDDDSAYFPWRWLDYACGKKEIPGLPSWVPDLHYGFTSTNYFGFEHEASGRRGMAMEGQQTGEIIITGTIVQTIFAICAPAPSVSDFDAFEDYLLELAQWEEAAHEFCTGLRHAQRRGKNLSDRHLRQETRYWQTLVNYDRSRDLSYKSYESFIVALQSFARNDNKLYAPIVEDAPPAWSQRARKRANLAFRNLYYSSNDAGHYRWQMENAVRDRQVFRTCDGLFGFTNKGVLPGDDLCVFNGAPTPHVLRKVSDRSDEAYRLVGNAFVYDLMHGEVDDMDLPEQGILLV